MEYLNKLSQMQEQVNNFGKRKLKLDEGMAVLKGKVDS